MGCCRCRYFILGHFVVGISELLETLIKNRQPQRQGPEPSVTTKWATTLRFGKI